MSKFIGFHLINKLLTLVLFGKTYECDAKHPKYKEISENLRPPTTGETEDEERERATKLLTLVQSTNLDSAVLQNAIGFSDVVVEHGVVTVKGKPLRNTLTQRILDLKVAGLPYDSLVKFLVNCAQNPDPESVEDLFDFLEQGKFGFTDDGCFLGYKGVIEGELDGKRTLVDQHSMSFDMSPGNRHEMPRDQVDNNRNQACGAGFHIGTIDHARGFGRHMIVVKCNPKDVVSVPKYDRTKLRCCAYEVVHQFKDEPHELTKPVYKSSEVEDYAPASSTAPAPGPEFDTMNRDQLIRAAAAAGLIMSVTEGRALGKERLLECLKKGALPLDDMTALELAELCTRRKHFSSITAARKAGVTLMKQALMGL